MNDELELVTGLSERDRQKIFNWVGSLPDTMAIDIFQDAVKKAYQLKDERPDLQGKVVKYCAFVVAARNAGWGSVHGKGYRIAEKKQFEDFAYLRKTAAAKIAHQGRTPVLRRKVKAYWGEIKALKAEGLGFRPIAVYLLKKRKIKVSVSYLKMIWNEVETP